MTTSTDTGASTDASTPTADTETGTDTGSGEVDKWKALARKHEQQSKANERAAQELATLKAEKQTDAEKQADKARQDDERFAKLEAKVLRRDVALEHKLTREDAELLEDVTDEDAMRNLAKRLSNDDADRKKNGNRAPNEGRTPPSPPTDPIREFTRELFGTADS